MTWHYKINRKKNIKIFSLYNNVIIKYSYRMYYEIKQQINLFDRDEIKTLFVKMILLLTVGRYLGFF